MLPLAACWSPRQVNAGKLGKTHSEWADDRAPTTPDSRQFASPLIVLVGQTTITMLAAAHCLRPCPAVPDM